MKYLDILKQFDKAIVTESQKLQDIYDNICKGETPNNQVCNEDETEEKKEIKDKEGCPDCGNDLDKCTCGKEEKKEVTENSDEADKKQMCEFSEGEKKDTEDGKMLSAEKFFAGVDKEGDAEEEKTADDSEKKDEEPIEKKEEKTADAEEAKKEEVPAEEKKDEEKTEEAPAEEKKDEEEQKNESSVDQRAAISASELFEDDKEEEKKEEEKPAEEKSEEKTEEAPAEEKKEEEKPVEKKADEESEKKEADESCKADESCNGKKCETAADWLNEGEEKKEEKKEEEKSAEEKSEEKTEEAPADDEDDEEKAEKEALQESIKNISAFVEANKRLFGG